MDKRHSTVTLDVREDIKHGREPFMRIMDTVGKLGPRTDLLLVAPFEPRPLYSILESHGFTATARVLESGDYEVRFSRRASVRDKGEPTVTPPLSGPGAPVVEVDARGLEPPQPLVAILEAVASLPKGTHLRARTDRRPMHLYTQLYERGFSGQTEEQPDGSFITYVRPL